MSTLPPVLFSAVALAGGRVRSFMRSGPLKGNARVTYGTVAPTRQFYSMYTIYIKTYSNGIARIVEAIETTIKLAVVFYDLVLQCTTTTILLLYLSTTMADLFQAVCSQLWFNEQKHSCT